MDGQAPNPQPKGQPMSVISDSPTLPVDSRKSSAALGVAVGSGSRPTNSKFKIETSAPMDPHGLGRKPAGALEQTGGKSD